jgi:hypothetical protein
MMMEKKETFLVKFFLGNYLGGLGLAIWSRKTTGPHDKNLKAYQWGVGDI